MKTVNISLILHELYQKYAPHGGGKLIYKEWPRILFNSSLDENSKTSMLLLGKIQNRIHTIVHQHLLKFNHEQN